MPEKNHEYARWADKAAINASSLADEARILFEHKKYERAYYLSHMANEESSKALLLKLLPSLGVQSTKQNGISRLLRDHKKKNELILRLVEDFASRQNDTDFFDCRTELTRFLNDKKNNTMYVSMEKGKVITPRETIENIDVEKCVLLALKLAKWVSALNSEKQANSNGYHSETR
jgi:AbiV family abortive infection protein